MKRVLNTIGYVLIVVALQIVLLGALYKIQSWEMPYIGGNKVDLIVLGVLLVSGGSMLVLAAKLMKKEERLELDPDRITKSAEKEEVLLRDDDQYV